MKESKRAIEEIFKNKEFASLLKDYFDGDIDPYMPEEWDIDSWGIAFDRFDMNDDGAAAMMDMRHNQVDSVIVNTTYPEDTMFSAISVDKDYGAIFLWFLDLVGLNYEDMKNFDAYDYDGFNEWKTMNSDNDDDDDDDEDEEDEEW